MYFCSKEQTSKQDKAKHSKQNGFQIVTRTPAYCAEHPSTKGCRFSIQSYGKSLEILRAVLEQYPDSLGAFILEESANALYQGADSIYMKDIDGIRKRFPNRLLEIEMIRRLKPHSLVKQIKKIQIENEYNIDFDLDSLVNEMEKQQKL